ncbi:hypothetical protein, partial [Paraburkholderia tropica]
MGPVSPGNGSGAMAGRLVCDNDPGRKIFSTFLNLACRGAAPSPPMRRVAGFPGDRTVLDEDARRWLPDTVLYAAMRIAYLKRHCSGIATAFTLQPEK